MSNFDSLRDYLDLVEEKSLLKRIEHADWNLEIGTLTEIVAYSKSPYALLFDSIKDYPKGYRVASDLYVSERLQALALGLPEDASNIELVKLWRRRTANLVRRPPREVSDGPVKENVVKQYEVDVLKFPVPKWHEYDGGRYFGTGDAVITRDPEENWTNLGVYRIQVHNEKLLGLHVAPQHHGTMMMEKYWSKGKDAPVAVAEGQDPLLYCGACTPLPWGYSEYEFAAGLREKAVDVIIDSETGLQIPASAEIVVFGHVPPPQKEMHEEGPYGECMGYYKSFGPCPVIHVDKIWHRNDPILQGNPTMGHSAMTHALGGQILTAAGVWDALEREIPNVTGVYPVYQPCSSGPTILAVSIKQSYQGHAKQAALGALISRAGIMNNKMVVVVDDDVDPSDLQDVLFAMMSRCDPCEDIDIIRGTPASPLDPSVPYSNAAIGVISGSTMVVDATRKPFHLRNKFSRVNSISPELRAKTIVKWADSLGLS